MSVVLKIAEKILMDLACTILWMRGSIEDIRIRLEN